MFTCFFVKEAIYSNDMRKSCVTPRSAEFEAPDAADKFRLEKKHSKQPYRC